MKVFGCLHKHVDVFLHNYANAIWNLKGPESLPLSVLVIFYQQKNSIILQRLQASSILSQVIAIRPSYSLTSTLLGHISHLHDMTCCKRLVFYMEKYSRPTTSDQFLTWIGLKI
jgi:hypothetical protein